ncbi:EbsA family protein [Lentilactobacillus kisonensis]|uniref:Pore-forming protein n=1 Tax=Lentilactobacillus kisonensis F0435 TaxID=797516 RepID=H1LG85_9LACO|nr:EbsA family protein [Lentilactobacillus kisonensis]EHO51097.1 hypothetical protein HMPREF9104_01612 [Lentilactobacillus kisonensis F0435]
MISQKRHFFYQPSPLGSIICWSWTFIIFFVGVIFWLEITHFQWITLFFFIFFAIVAWAEIHFRNIKIYHNQLVVSRITNPHWLVIDLDKISHVQVSKYQLGFVANTRIYSFILPANSVIEIKELITNR